MPVRDPTRTPHLPSASGTGVMRVAATARALHARNRLMTLGGWSVAIAMGVSLLGVIAVRLWTGAAWWWVVPAVLVGATAVLTAVFVWARRWSIPYAAGEVDRANATEGALRTALEISDADGEPVFVAMARARGQSVAAQADVARAVPLARVDGWWWALGAAGICLAAGFLIPQADWNRVQRRPDPSPMVQRAAAEVATAQVETERVDESGLPDPQAWSRAKAELEALEEELRRGDAAEDAPARTAAALNETADELDRQSELAARAEQELRDRAASFDPAATPERTRATELSERLADALARNDLLRAQEAAREIDRAAESMTDEELRALSEALEDLASTLDPADSRGILPDPPSQSGRLDEPQPSRREPAPPSDPAGDPTTTTPRTEPTTPDTPSTSPSPATPEQPPSRPDQPRQQPTEQPQRDPSAQEPSQEPGNQSDQPSGQPQPRPGEREQSSPQPGERPGQEPSGQPTEQSERPGEQPGDQSGDQTRNQSDNPAGDQTGDQTGDQVGDQSREQPGNEQNREGNQGTRSVPDALRERAEQLRNEPRPDGHSGAQPDPNRPSDPNQSSDPGQPREPNQPSQPAESPQGEPGQQPQATEQPQPGEQSQSGQQSPPTEQPQPGQQPQPGEPSQPGQQPQPGGEPQQGEPGQQPQSGQQTTPDQSRQPGQAPTQEQAPGASQTEDRSSPGAVERAVQDMQQRQQARRQNQRVADSLRDRARGLIDPDHQPHDTSNAGAGSQDAPVTRRPITDDPSHFEPVDATRGQPAGDDSGRVVGEWFDPDRTELPPSERQAAAGEMRQAARRARDAVENQQVPRRYRDLVQRVFERVERRADEVGSVAPQGRDAAP